MFTLRNDHLQAFAAGAEGRFVARLRQHLETDGELSEASVRDFVARARLQGFESERQITVFAELCLQFGKGFEESRWAAAILDSGEDGDTRIERLERRAADHPVKGGR